MYRERYGTNNVLIYDIYSNTNIPIRLGITRNENMQTMRVCMNKFLVIATKNYLRFYKYNAEEKVVNICDFSKCLGNIDISYIECSRNVIFVLYNRSKYTEPTLQIMTVDKVKNSNKYKLEDIVTKSFKGARPYLFINALGNISSIGSNSTII